MKNINIIYILPELKGASGGGKVIYNHSNIINSLGNNLSSQILHVKKSLSYKLKISISKRINFFNDEFSGWNGKKIRVSKKFKPDRNWFNKNINIKKDMNFNPKNDFIILPEILAHFAEDLEFKKKKIKYAIFVQGLYHMNTTSDYKKIKSCYENANYIITSSQNSLKFIKDLFPKIKNKIHKIELSVGNIKLKSKKKLNLITCMFRKLPAHYLLLLFYLRNKLPSNWKIENIDRVSEKKLYDKYFQSKIFLSFSHLEGLGLPPIEAALCGNKVIGYDGGGGKEYWKKPIFNKVEYGNIQSFGNIVIKEIKNYKNSWITQTSKQRKNIKIKYSEINEKKTLLNLCKKINYIF